MSEFGVWDRDADAFISTQAYSAAEAEADRQRLAGEQDPDDRAEFLADTSVRPVCGDHAEQPADACEDCDAEDPL